MMMWFWLIGAALVVISLAIIAPALLRSRSLGSSDRDQQNILIARERIAELAQERDEGILSADEFEQARLEVESAMLIDVDQRDDGEDKQVAGVGKGTLISIALLMPLLAALLYLQLGEPRLINGPVGDAHQGVAGQASGDMGSVSEMITRLVNRLNENPEDAEGWFMLGRTMMVMDDYPKAVAAFEASHRLLGDDPSVMLALADALAMSNEGDMSGRTGELVLKALALEPANPTALWMAGMIAEREQDYPQAMAYWQRLEPLVAESPEDAEQVRRMMTRTRSLMGEAAAAPDAQPFTPMPPAAAPATTGGDGAGGIRLQIVVDAALAPLAGPDDRVYVYARALNGAGPPLSAAQVRVRDLPLEMILDDSGSVMSSNVLSSHQQVLVGARVSKSGDAMPRAGDIRGEVSPVAVGSQQAVEIVIDTLVP